MNHKVLAVIDPTGVGKTLLIDHIKKSYNFLTIPSVTTRKKRKAERGYRYVTKEEFEGLIKDNKLLEYTFHDGNYYGKLISDFENFIEKNHCIYLITADQVEKLKKQNAEVILVSLSYSDTAAVTNRLSERGHSQSEIESRLQTVAKDLQGVEKLRKLGLIDYEIETIEGNREHTLQSAENIIKNHF